MVEGGGVLVGVDVGVEVCVVVGVLVGVGVEVGVLVGVVVGVGVTQDTVKLTYWFCPLEVTVVLDGVMVHPGTVVAVSVTVASGQ